MAERGGKGRAVASSPGGPAAVPAAGGPRGGRGISRRRLLGSAAGVGAASMAAGGLLPGNVVKAMASTSSGRLPAVSWVFPTLDVSEHPSRPPGLRGSS
jgi:hypothetical protein